MGVSYHMIVEQDDYKNYADVVAPKDRVLILPQRYHDEYELCSTHPHPSNGPGPARNFALYHSGFAKRHWVMDDNLQSFHRLNRNKKPHAWTPAVFTAMEDFVDRYTNVPVAGPNYLCFCKTTDSFPPFSLNTRIYSCLLISNSIKYQWRGRYNEDTDLCLRVLKDGDCTILFNAFLQDKVTTQRMRGGNTAEFYAHEGTLNKSQMLADMHPDVASVVEKFNRTHHKVDYKRFRDNQLVRADGTAYSGVNEYGMALTTGNRAILRP
jgi:hypothetical protein